jgi:hypothetical protein
LKISFIEIINAMENSTSDIEYLTKVYRTARNKYKPDPINVLLVAEAPPCALDRFFYFEDVKKQDSLFLEIMGILYPEEKQRYLRSGRDTSLKKDILGNFQTDGYWMLDLCEIPTSISNGSLDNYVPSLISRLEKLITKNTPIILIKTDVYDSCYDALTAEGYRVVNERMPFPGSGQQKVFREKFKKAIELL